MYGGHFKSNPGVSLFFLKSTRVLFPWKSRHLWYWQRIQIRCKGRIRQRSYIYPDFIHNHVIQLYSPKCLTSWLACFEAVCFPSGVALVTALVFVIFALVAPSSCLDSFRLMQYNLSPSSNVRLFIMQVITRVSSSSWAYRTAVSREGYFAWSFNKTLTNVSPVKTSL